MPLAEWKLIVTRTVKNFGDDKCSSFAAAVAYYTLLSIFPLIIFAISFAGFFIHGDAETKILNTLMDNLPLDPSSRPQLRDTLAAIAGGRGGLGVLGLVMTAYSASSLFSALRTGLNVIFQVKQQRPMVQGIILDTGMVFGTGVLLLLSLGLTIAIAYVQTFIKDLLPGGLTVLIEVGLSLAYFVVPGLVSFAVFMIIYKYVPHVALTWKDVLPGAILAAVGFEALKIGFAQYATHFGNYDAVYGSLGFVIAFLALAYFAAQVVLLGGEFIRSYAEVSSGAVPGYRPAVPKRPQSLVQTVENMVKGLFVETEPHHEERLPYKPAAPGGPLTDTQAEQRAGRVRQPVQSASAQVAEVRDGNGDRPQQRGNGQG